MVSLTKEVVRMLLTLMQRVGAYRQICSFQNLYQIPHTS